MDKILVSGGTGTVGTALCKKLLHKGYEVYVLSRRASKKLGPHYFRVQWDINKRFIDIAQLPPGPYALIHLAGAPVMGSSWTQAYKEEMQRSRVDSLQLIIDAMGKDINYICSASGVNYYFDSSKNKVFTEDDAPEGKSFLSKLCIDWEKAALQNKEQIPASCLRTGLVISKHPPFDLMLRVAKLGLLMPLGSGKQAFPWIYLDDLVSMYVFALEKRIVGPYNAVAPKSCSQKGFFKALCSKLSRPLWPALLPNFILSWVLGERAPLLTQGAPISADKILSEGFHFTVSDEHAAAELLLR